MTEGLFISYRRSDTQSATGRLADHLRQTGFGGDGDIFLDIDHRIPPGVDFRVVINETLAGCDLVIVVIGRHWVDATDGEGRRRLDRPSDTHRLEVAAALDSDARVIPVLVEGALHPTEEDLPDDLKVMAFLQSWALGERNYSKDVETLAGLMLDARVQMQAARELAAADEAERLAAAERAARELAAADEAERLAAAERAARELAAADEAERLAAAERAARELAAADEAERLAAAERAARELAAADEAERLAAAERAARELAAADEAERLAAAERAARELAAADEAEQAEQAERLAAAERAERDQAAADLVSKWAALRDAGVLTEDEFQAQTSDIPQPESERGTAEVAERERAEAEEAERAEAEEAERDEAAAELFSKWAALRDSGVLTEDEFQAQTSDIPQPESERAAAQRSWRTGFDINPRVAGLAPLIGLVVWVIGSVFLPSLWWGAAVAVAIAIAIASALASFAVCCGGVLSIHGPKPNRWTVAGAWWAILALLMIAAVALILALPSIDRIEVLDVSAVRTPVGIGVLTLPLALLTLAIGVTRARILPRFGIVAVWVAALVLPIGLVPPIGLVLPISLREVFLIGGTVPPLINRIAVSVLFGAPWVVLGIALLRTITTQESN